MLVLYRPATVADWLKMNNVTIARYPMPSVREVAMI
jgi:hypothetical protein